MKKPYLLLIFPVLLLILAGCTNQNQANPKNAAINSTSTANLNAKTSLPLTMAELAKHNSKTDCWQLIDGQIYDLSPYTSSGAHPGGDSILKGCGQDATAAFNAVGKHNGQAKAMLPSFLLGPVSN